jgi:hypothetical protein
MKPLERLGIREIMNDAVIFEDGTFAAVLSLKIPEFKKLSKRNQMKSIAGFRFWLDSLEHPVQICARTVGMGLKDRLTVFKANAELHIKKKKEYKDSMLDFSRFYKWLEDYALKSSSSRRLYYIVIPYLPYFHKKSEFKKLKRKDEYFKKLDQRTENSIRLLKHANIHAVRLSDEELNNMYSSFLLFSFYNKKGYYDTIEDCLKKWLQEGEE